MNYILDQFKANEVILGVSLILFNFNYPPPPPPLPQPTQSTSSDYDLEYSDTHAKCIAFFQDIKHGILI